MLFLLAPALALGAVEQCMHMTADCSDTPQCMPMTDEQLNLPCVPDDEPEPNSTVRAYNYNCIGTDLDVEYHTKADCSGSVSAECQWEMGADGLLPPSGCHLPFVLGECKTLIDVMGVGLSIKFTGSCPASDGDDPCFSRETEACRILDTSASPSDALRACFDEPVSQVAERVAMAALVAGDYVLSAGEGLTYEYTRIVVNQHRLASQKRSGVVKITHPDGDITLTPDHVLLVDGEWAAARSVKVGSTLSGSKVTAVSQGVAGIINPLTANGMIIAAGPTGKPVVATVYPEWIASYMLNVAVFPLPISLSNLLTYLFPAAAQAYYDKHLEAAFADHQSHLRKWKRDLPTVLIAPLIAAVDLLCAVGFVLYALASPKVLAALAAVAVVARARRAKA